MMSSDENVVCGVTLSLYPHRLRHDTFSYKHYLWFSPNPFNLRTKNLENVPLFWQNAKVSSDSQEHIIFLHTHHLSLRIVSLNLPDKLKNTPDHGGNQTYDLRNVSLMFCQLS